MFPEYIIWHFYTGDTLISVRSGLIVVNDDDDDDDDGDDGDDETLIL